MYFPKLSQLLVVAVFAYGALALPILGMSFLRQSAYDAHGLLLEARHPEGAEVAGTEAVNTSDACDGGTSPARLFAIALLGD